MEASATRECSQIQTVQAGKVGPVRSARQVLFKTGRGSLDFEILAHVFLGVLCGLSETQSTDG